MLLFVTSFYSHSPMSKSVRKEKAKETAHVVEAEKVTEEETTEEDGIVEVEKLQSLGIASGMSALLKSYLLTLQETLGSSSWLGCIQSLVS